MCNLNPLVDLMSDFLMKLKSFRKFFFSRNMNTYNLKILLIFHKNRASTLARIAFHLIANRAVHTYQFRCSLCPQTIRNNILVDLPRIPAYLYSFFPFEMSIYPQIAVFHSRLFIIVMLSGLQFQYSIVIAMRSLGLLYMFVRIMYFSNQVYISFWFFNIQYKYYLTSLFTCLFVYYVTCSCEDDISAYETTTATCIYIFCLEFGQDESDATVGVYWG